MCTTLRPLARGELKRNPTPTSYNVPEGRSRARIAAADSADVAEHGPADAEQPPRIEIREEALLDVQDGAVLAGLVANRVAAQAVVAAEQHLVLGIEIVGRQ